MSPETKRKMEMHKNAPLEFLALCNEEVRSDPEDPYGYWSRHRAWTRLGRKDLALADLNRALSLQAEDCIGLESRANLYRSLGDYKSALADLDRAESLDPKGFAGCYAPLFRADCHARLGNEAAALADCAKLRDDHWTPGLLGAPRGTKAQVIAEVRALAAAARMKPEDYE